MSTPIEDLDEKAQSFIAQLETDKSWVLNYYSNRNTEFERMESWYYKEHYNANAEVNPDGGMMDESVDENDHLTIFPILTTTVNSVHGILTDEDPYIQCVSSIGRKSQDKATATERLCHGTHWINRQVAGDDPWEAATFDFLVMGWGCVYTYWDTERAELARSKAHGRPKDVLDFYAYPIIERRVNPRDVYPLPYGVREQWRGVFQIVSRTVREVEDEWGTTIDPIPELGEDGLPKSYEDGTPCMIMYSDDSLIEFVDYWVWVRDNGKTGDEANDDWTLWHCVMAADQVMKPPTPMYEYEMLPYEIFFCRRTGSDVGARMGLSFMYPMIEPVQEMEYLANRQSRLIDQYADPMLALIDSANGQDQTIEKGPGTTLYLNAGGDAHYVTWTGSPPDIGQLMRLWREVAQEAFPPVMTGLSGGTSGLDTIALQQGGKLQTSKPRRNLELAMQRVNTKIIRLLQKFSWDEPLFVIGQRTEEDDKVPFAFSIKGKDTRGFENTIVTIRGRFPQEELHNVVVASQAVAAGMMSQRRASGKYMYVQDPQAEFKAWSQEQLLKDPTLRQFFMQMYMQLPIRTPVSEALTKQPTEDTEAADLAGGQIAAATATNDSEVQQSVQRTPVASNAYSALAGGIGG